MLSSDLRPVIMEANNAAELSETNPTSVDTVASTTSTDVIDAGDAATVEGNTETSVESTEQATTVDELFYDIDGEETSVNTVMEWKKGHMFQNDYTKKSQANAEVKKQLDAKHLEADGLKTSLSDSIAALEESIKATSDNVDMEDSRVNDTAEYLRQKEQIETKKALAQKAKADLEVLNNQQQQDLVQAERQLMMDAMPTWADDKQREADMNLVVNDVNERGFTDADTKALQSHRLMLMAVDAAKYKALQKETAEVKKAVEKAPNVIKARPKSVKKATTAAQRMYPNM